MLLWCPLQCQASVHIRASVGRGLSAPVRCEGLPERLVFREEIVCAGSEIVSAPSPWVEGDVLTVLASRDGRERSSGQVPCGKRRLVRTCPGRRGVRLLVIVVSRAFKQSMTSFGP